jgi:hypothetical protein
MFLKAVVEVGFGKRQHGEARSHIAGYSSLPDMKGRGNVCGGEGRDVGVF